MNRLISILFLNLFSNKEEETDLMVDGGVVLNLPRQFYIKPN
jgi:hypothetical protein